jgi:two-component system, sensor histidine kinase RegB
MRVCVAEPGEASVDLRSAWDLAPNLALPWVARLRYGVLAGQATLILAARFGLGTHLDILWLSLPLAATAGSNLAIGRLADRYGVRPTLGAMLARDTISLTALLALSGGPANPFTLLYLVQIALSAVVLSRQWTWGIGALSVAGFGLLFKVHTRLDLLESHHSTGFSSHLVGMSIAFAAAALLVTVFIGKVSDALRQREREVLALRDQLARHDRLGSIATLAAGAAHELNTPLGTIAVAAGDLALSADAGVASEARLIRSEVDRCRGILRQMSAGEPPGETPARVSVPGLLEAVLRGFPAADRERIRTESGKSGRLAVLPANATRQALAALVRNALDASPAGKQVLLAADCRPDRLRFTVRDWGTGMTAETLRRVAEPFFTSKPPGHGMGLGTFLVRVFARQMQGRLAFESEPGAGTTAVLEIPAEADER